MIPTDEAGIPDTQMSDPTATPIDAVAGDEEPVGDAELSDDATRESEVGDVEEDDASAQRLREENEVDALRRGRNPSSPDGSWEPTPRSQETNSTLSSNASPTSHDDVERSDLASSTDEDSEESETSAHRIERLRKRLAKEAAQLQAQQEEAMRQALAAEHHRREAFLAEMRHFDQTFLEA